ncbi:Distantly related to Glycosyltransferase of family GT9 [Synechococcus sp. WH 7803]|nr:Distantly related to Glycosyltransferase of family GT9 [Synechococcus sp. WH 7803]
MQRYAGEHLGVAPHIVVLGSCKVGNFVVSTPVLHGLRERFPDAVIGFIGSEVTADFEAADPCINWRMSWDAPTGQGDALYGVAKELSQRRQAHGPVALAVNLDGFNPVTRVLASFLEPLWVAGGALDASRRRDLPWGDQPSQAFMGDPDWDSLAFLERHQHLFKSNYIAELFAVLAGVADYCDPTAIRLQASAPSFAVPDVLIHCTTARAAKIWPFDYWRDVVKVLTQKGFSVGLIGSPPKQQQAAYNSGGAEEWLLAETQLIDLRGRTSLSELAGACQQARAVISVDAGPLHIAAAMGSSTLAVVGNDGNGIGASPVRLWMPRCENAQRTVSSVTCQLCAEAQFRNDQCLAEHHDCMLSVQPEQVLAWLDQVLE